MAKTRWTVFGNPKQYTISEHNFNKTPSLIICNNKLKCCIHKITLTFILIEQTNIAQLCNVIIILDQSKKKIPLGTLRKIAKSGTQIMMKSERNKELDVQFFI